MSRRRFGRACIALLLLGVIVFGCAVTRSFARHEPPETTTISAKEIDSFVVDIEEMVHHLRGQQPEQVDDELRDWAVYGTLIRMRLDPQAMLRASSKILPVRPSSSAPPIALAQGRGRRALVSNEDALLFVDDTDPDPAGTIERLAREIRAESSGKPVALHVFRISPDVTAAEIHVTRMPLEASVADAGPDGRLASALGDAAREWLSAHFKVPSTAVAAGRIRTIAKPKGGRGGGRSRSHGSSDGPSYNSSHGTSRGSSHGRSYDAPQTGYSSAGHYEKPGVSAPPGVPWYRWNAPERPRRSKPASSEIPASSTGTVWSGPQSVRVHHSVLPAGQIQIEAKYPDSTSETLSGGQTAPDRVTLRLDPGEGVDAQGSVARSATSAGGATSRLHVQKDGREVTLARTASGAIELDVSATSARAARVVTQDELTALVYEHEWQRLTVTPGKEASTSTVAVQRAYGGVGPSPGARELTLEHGPDFPECLPEVKVYVDPDGSIFVQRLPKAYEAHWRDLDVSLGLSPRDMQRIADKARAGVTTLRRAEITAPGAERTYRRIRSDDPKGALRAMRESIDRDQKGSHALAEEVRAKVVDQADRHLADGDGAKARSLYDFAAEVGGHPPEIELRSALAEIQSGLPKRALDRLGDPARLSPEAIVMIEATPMLGDLPDVVAARKNPSQHILGAPATELELVAEGTEVRSALKVSRMPEGEEIALPDREDIASSPAGTVFYIDDRISLNRHDLEVEGYGRLTEIAHTPDVRWESVVMAGEVHRPGILVETRAQTRYLRHASPVSRAGSPGGMRVVRIRHVRRGCDVNCNGIITDDERQACSLSGRLGCDINCNGTLTDDERAACILPQASR